MAALLQELIFLSADRTPAARALAYGDQTLSYGALAAQVTQTGRAILGLGLTPHERVAVYLEKRFETVTAMFGAAAAGCVFVPINPLLKAEQVAYILRDCNVRALVTSGERLELLAPVRRAQDESEPAPRPAAP